jgi:catechol 2,3-dioxygenase-like lactoylglutathione lyase family enzyme
MKRLVNIFFFFLVLQPVEAQELNAKVNVVYAQISSNVDKRVFQNLQTSLQNFINKRKWTSDNFESNEKIECSFLLNLQSVVESNVYKATLTVQAARPVYNTSYLSPLINFIDNDLVFRYVEFQPIEFNENRIAGTEPLTANLTAAIAFYVNLILGLDYDSFSPKGGDPFFQKANMIVNAAPEGRSITGWRAFDGQRNRYWLSENLQNSKYAQVHDAIYTYYRKGLDQMLTNEKDARTQIIQALNFLSVVHAETPNVMIIPFFFQGRSDEIIRIFKKSTPQEKNQVAELSSKMDITNASLYNAELK